MMNPRLYIEDPRKYFPDLLPGWHWSQVPDFAEGEIEGIPYRMGAGVASADTIKSAVISVTTTDTSEDASNIIKGRVFELGGYGAAVQRTGFLGDESWELYGPSELGGVDIWEVLWRRNSVLGIVYSPAKDDAYAWVDATDAIFPSPLPWKWIAVGIIGCVAVGGLLLAR